MRKEDGDFSSILKGWGFPSPILMIDILKYSIIIQAITMFVQGGIIYITPQQIIQPNDIMEEFEESFGIEILIINRFPMLEQYYYFQNYLSGNYELLDIVEDSVKLICYLKVKRK